MPRKARKKAQDDLLLPYSFTEEELKNILDDYTIPIDILLPDLTIDELPDELTIDDADLAGLLVEPDAALLKQWDEEEAHMKEVLEDSDISLPEDAFPELNDLDNDISLLWDNDSNDGAK